MGWTIATIDQAIERYLTDAAWQYALIEELRSRYAPAPARLFAARPSARLRGKRFFLTRCDIAEESLAMR